MEDKLLVKYIDTVTVNVNEGGVVLEFGTLTGGGEYQVVQRLGCSKAFIENFVNKLQIALKESSN